MVTRIGPKKPFRLYIAEYRELAGLTQPQLAARVGTTKTSISRWENGERDPTTKVLAALAYALNKEVADLFRDPRRPSAAELLAEVRKTVKLDETIIDEEKGTGTDR